MRSVLLGTCLAGLVVTAASAQVREAPRTSLPDTGRTATAEDVARRFVASEGQRVFGVRADERLVQRSVAVDHDTVAVRFDTYLSGVRVWGGEAVVQVDGPRAAVAGVVNRHRHAAGIDLRPDLSEADAVGLAWSALAPAAAPVEEPRAELVVYPKDGYDHLAWTVDAFFENDVEEPAARFFVIDAHTGAILDQWDNLHTGKGGKPGGGGGGGGTGTAASGTAVTLYSGTVPIDTQSINGAFDMTDLTRGSMTTTDMLNRQAGSGSLFTDADNLWGDGTESDRATAGAEAHFGAEMTWDYYLTTFGRNGIYDDGKGTPSRVHYGRNYNNAFWSDSCRCMTYGDGDGRVLSPLVSLDVAGHEMTHGVTSATANLVYSGESGGLNESMSDIFGTAVEFFAAAHGAQTVGDYLIGEDIYTPGTSGDALRYMDDPTRDGRSIDHYSQYSSGMDVHYSSGLANNVFYLLSEGGTNKTSGIAVTGIGRARTEAVFYRALTVYMTSGETFAQARTDTVKAAQDLYGSTIANAVAGAWTAAGVN